MFLFELNLSFNINFKVHITPLGILNIDNSPYKNFVIVNCFVVKVDESGVKARICNVDSKKTAKRL